MKFEATSHVGKIRENNEDFYYASDSYDFPLFVVADGIGGRNYGEIASQTSVNYIKDNLLKKDDYESIDQLEEDFVKILIDVNSLIYEMSQEDKKYSGMGTTLTIVYIYDDSLLIGNIGDSRVYSISNSNIRQLTVDDTYVNKLVELGEITRDEALNHPKKNVITNAIGTDTNVDINIVQYNYNPDEYILACTDGLTDMLSNDEILEIFMENDNLSDIKDNLLSRALDAGGRDNITFIIIQV